MTNSPRPAEIIVGGQTRGEVTELVSDCRGFILEHVAANIHSDVTAALLRVSSAVGK